MYKLLRFSFIFLLATTSWAFSQTPPDFDAYFIDATMRVDYFMTGDAHEEVITVDRIYRQSIWAGNPNTLLDPFNNGKYYVKIYDVASNRCIFSRGFANIFAEYQTTDPAHKGEKRTYHNSVLVPYPKKSILLVFESRNKKNMLIPIFSRTVDPDDVAIIREETGAGVRVYEALKNGDPHEKVDVVLLAEGYRANEYDAFKEDVEKFLRAFFDIEPYSSRKGSFNIHGLFVASQQSGVDQPRENIYRSTALNASFNALNLPRYLLTDDNKSMRDIASRVPYDAIVIMANSERYGGGGIYNFYAMSTVDNRLSVNVFVHEFGHSFAGLADEYYSSAVVYNDFYPRGVEPTEPNITALLDPENIKWKEYVTPGIEIPTDWGKEKVEELQKQRGELMSKMRSGELAGESLEQLREKMTALNAEIENVQTEYRSELAGKVGAFEGAGYASEGLYRPELNCLMFSNQQQQYCKVCRAAIIRMIDYYTK